MNIKQFERFDATTPDGKPAIGYSCTMDNGDIWNMIDDQGKYTWQLKSLGLEQLQALFAQFHNNSSPPTP